MQEIQDIFRIFDPEHATARPMAEAVGEKPDTVYRWLRAGRIPESAWQSVISAAQALGVQIDATTLFRLNKTPGKRGRPAKSNRVRRTRSTAEVV